VVVAPAREQVASLKGFETKSPYTVLQSGWGQTSALFYKIDRFRQKKTSVANRGSGQYIHRTPPLKANGLFLLQQRIFLLISQFQVSFHFNEEEKKIGEVCSRHQVPQYQ